MPTSSAGRLALPITLVAANLLLYVAGGWAGNSVPAADRSDPPVRPGRDAHRTLQPPALVRNPAYSRWLFESVRQRQGVLFLGTSESLHPFNLGAQLNYHRPQDPPLVVLAQAGMSPIHSALAFAAWKESGLSTPPLLMVVNLVYFTRSHDVIQNGWMGKVARAPVFAYMDHGGLLSQLGEEARQAYQEHFASYFWLHPLYHQQYLGNLLYLQGHRAGPEDLPAADFGVQRFDYQGPMPHYDESRNVHRGLVASDRRAPWRWTVSPVDRSRNLMGLRSIVAGLGEDAGPVLLLVLPTNRTFYQYHGLDMDEYQRAHQAQRRVIAGLEQDHRVVVVDLYDMPLDRGFVDRMHLDGYGYRQAVDALGSHAGYQRFQRAVAAYYAGRAGD
jgi:hypothetical protein